MIVIPPQQVSDEILQNLVAEFVSRDGTDYGAIESNEETKISQVLAQLKTGQAVIVFDEDEQSCNIVAKEHLPPQLG